MNLKDDKAPILNIFNSVIKDQNLNSQYFLDWLLINFQPHSLYLECIPKNDLNVFNQTENNFSFAKSSELEHIATFKQKDNAIIYDFSSNIHFENDFLIDLIKNTLKGDSQEDCVLDYASSIYGPLRMRVSRWSTELLIKILFMTHTIFKENKYYYINPLKIILAHYKEHNDLITDEQLNEIKKAYQNIMDENIDLDNIDKTILLLTELEETVGMINY